MELKELYSIAKEQLMQVFEDARDFRLEQVEYDEKEKIWEIVVSFVTKNIDRADSVVSPLAKVVLPFERLYKKVVIDDNKKMKAFYIYERV